MKKKNSKKSETNNQTSQSKISPIFNIPETFLWVDLAVITTMKEPRIREGDRFIGRHIVYYFGENGVQESNKIRTEIKKLETPEEALKTVKTGEFDPFFTAWKNFKERQVNQIC